MARLTIRVDFDSGDSLGPGKVSLLEAVARTGSIRKAAQETGMSFRQAWLLLKAIEEMVGRPVIATLRGGSHGGGARLTALGEVVVASYRRLEKGAAQGAREELLCLAAEVRAPGETAPAPSRVVRKAMKRKTKT